MAAPKKIKMVALVSSSLHGRFPKLKSTNFPNGLVFRRGVMEIPESDFKEISEGEKTAFMFSRYRQLGKLRILGVDTNSIPNQEKVRVISGRALSTSETGGVPAAKEHKVDQFPPADDDKSSKTDGKGISLAEE
jgi:hypothetical protein